MLQQVNRLAAKPDDQILIPRAHMVGERSAFDLLLHRATHTSTRYTCMHKQK